jgi:hypothetical protein
MVILLDPASSLFGRILILLNIKPETMQATLSFYECEHNGDLENYISDIRDSGGRIIGSKVDLEEEIGYVLFEHDSTFWGKFKKTESYTFIN